MCRTDWMVIYGSPRVVQPNASRKPALCYESGVGDEQALELLVFISSGEQPIAGQRLIPHVEGDALRPTATTIEVAELSSVLGRRPRTTCRLRGRSILCYFKVSYPVTPLDNRRGKKAKRSCPTKSDVACAGVRLSRISSVVIVSES